MRLAYLVVASLIVLFGAFHTVSTARFFDALTPDAIWFAGAGLAMVLTGAINLLNRAYGAAASGIRWTTFGSNLVMAAFAALAGRITGASIIDLVVIVGLLAVLTLLSFTVPRVSA